MWYEGNGRVFMHLGLADLYIRRVQEIPFTPERKIMTTIHKNLNHNNKLETYVKGACEVILDRCSNVLCDGKSLPLSDEVKA